MTLGQTPAAQRYEAAHKRLSAVKNRPDLKPETGRPIWAPAQRLWESAEVLSRVMDASTRSADGESGISTDEIGAALALFEEFRVQADQLECQLIMEARRRGMDWSQIKDEQGLKTAQAASQRYQRLTTRLEEIRQGVR